MTITYATATNQQKAFPYNGDAKAHNQQVIEWAQGELVQIIKIEKK